MMNGSKRVNFFRKRLSSKWWKKIFHFFKSLSLNFNNIWYVSSGVTLFFQLISEEKMGTKHPLGHRLLFHEDTFIFVVLMIGRPLCRMRRDSIIIKLEAEQNLLHSHSPQNIIIWWRLHIRILQTLGKKFWFRKQLFSIHGCKPAELVQLGDQFINLMC
jgi:hypothetical protein